MKKQNDHLSSLTFIVGEKGESTLFERKGKKDPSIRSKTETHFDTHVGTCKYCHKTFLITAWAMQVLPYARLIFGLSDIGHLKCSNAACSLCVWCPWAWDSMTDAKTILPPDMCFQTPTTYPSCPHYIFTIQIKCQSS